MCFSETFIKYDVLIVTASYTQSYVNAETGETETRTIDAGTYGRPDIYSDEYAEYTHQEILELLSTSEWTKPWPSGSMT